MIRPETNVTKLEMATKISLFQQCRKAMCATSRHDKQTVSINLSKRILTLIDNEAEKEHRKRSDWAELHFEEHFKEAKQPQEAAMKLG